MPTIFNSNINMSSVQIFIRTLRNKTLSIHLESTATVYELKDFIERKYKIPIETQQLFHQGRLLKNKRSLSTYKLNAQTTMNHPILLTQSFTVDVFISTKVSSLYSLTIDNNSKSKSKKKLHDNKELPSKQTIQCSSTTTIESILQQLNLSHLSHLLKVCAGAETEDIKDMSQKVIDIPNLLNDSIISILFSARWFLDRTVDIATFRAQMSQTIQKSINSSKLLRSCVSFNRLDYQFEKTQSFIISQCEELEIMLNEQTHEVNKASKWCNNLVKNNAGKKMDAPAQKLLNQLQNKIETIANASKIAQKKWNKKRTQIVSYVQNTIHKCETELMSQYKTWNYNDISEWLEYMDNRIVLNNYTIKQFEAANINGYNILNINDLSLKLMGIKDNNIRQLIVGYINALVVKFDDNKHNLSLDQNISYDECDDIDGNDRNVCCICVQKEVNTAIVPCGHAVYCNGCSKASMKHSDRCPICRQNVKSIIHIFKAGFNGLGN